MHGIGAADARQASECERRIVRAQNCPADGLIDPMDLG
jgi:hypothetical protein